MTRHEQWPPRLGLHWKNVSVLHRNLQHNGVFFEKSMPSINGVGFGWSENRCTGTPKSPRASFRTGSLDHDVAFDEAPSPKLNDLPPQGSNIGDSCIIFINVGEPELCILDASQRGGCTTIQQTKTFGPTKKCSMSFKLILFLDRINRSTAQEIQTARVVQVSRTVFDL